MRGIAVLLVPMLSACTSVEFRPSSPSRTHARIVPRAVRVEDPGPIIRCDADRIGMIHVEGKASDTLEALAEAAAENGGTHYVIRSDDRSDGPDIYTRADLGNTTVVRHSKGEGDRHMAALVYRLEPHRWECAGFRPPRER